MFIEKYVVKYVMTRKNKKRKPKTIEAVFAHILGVSEKSFRKNVEAQKKKTKEEWK